MKIQIPAHTIELVDDDVAAFKKMFGVDTNNELRWRIKRIARAEMETAIDERLKQLYREAGMP